MFDSAHGKIIAEEVYESIVDVYKDDPSVNIDGWNLTDWKVNTEIALGILRNEDGWDDDAEVSDEDMTDLFAWTYEQCGTGEERENILVGHFMDYLASSIEVAHVYGF